MVDGNDDLSGSFHADDLAINHCNSRDRELHTADSVAELVADMERGREQAKHHPNQDRHGEPGHGGLNESMQIRFDMEDSKMTPADNNHGDDSGPAPHKATYKDYLKAQRSFKMQSFRNHAVSSRNLNDPSHHPNPIPENKSAYEKQKRAISIVGSRQSMIQDSAAWKSFMKVVEVESEGEDQDNDDGDMDGDDDDDHRHHHHGSVTIPFYCAPVQRQRWGDDQMLPHINWGDIFFDLFYVAAAYNLGVLLISAMNKDDWPRGVVYFVGIFGPLFNAWENDLYYSSRYTVVDHFHRLFDVFRFLLVASVVIHIKSLELLSDSGSIETLALMGSVTLEAIMTLILNVELVLYADGDRTAIVNHTMRKIRHQYIPMVIVYLTATIIAAVFYAQSGDEIDSADATINGHDDVNYSSDPYNSTTEYGNKTDSTYEVDYDIYNTTGALGGEFRVLAADDDNDSDLASKGTVWVSADAPYLISCTYYLLDIIFTAVRKLRFSRDKTMDIREHFVPNNIDYLIHRYGEWTMLMIGESVLSLLIVETVESRAYYVTACVGVLTVILLQILKFESEPSHSDGHALWRSMQAAVCFSLLVQILSMGLIAFGVSYKVMLTTIAARELSSDDRYECGGSTLDDDNYQRLLGGQGGSCPEAGDGHRRLAEVPTVADQASAAVFCASLAIVLISLELMLLTHAGLLKNYRRLFSKLEHGDWKHTDFPLLFIGIAKLAIIIFTATISQWQTDPTTIAVLGFIIVSALAISRIVCWGLVHKQEQIKTFLSRAKERARESTKGAARVVGRATTKVSSTVAAAASVASSKPSESPSIKDFDRAVWDSSFDAIVVTDPTGIIRHVNQTCLSVFGYENEIELIGHNVTLLVGGGESENHPHYLEHFRKAKKTSSTIGKQRPLFSRRRDGSEFPCIVGIKQMPRSVDLIGYIRNTTGLNGDHTSEVKILDPVQQLMDDTSFDSIIATTKDGEIIACNMTTLSEFGYYNKDDLIGQNISILVGGNHAFKHDKYMERFQKKKKTETMLGKQRIIRARRVDQSEFGCLIHINAILDTDGFLVGYIRNIDGVTKKQIRLHAEEMSAMSKSSKGEDDLIDESFDSIIVADEEGIIHRVNMTALDMFRYDRKAELVGQNLSILVGGGLADKHGMFMKGFAESGRSESTIGRQRVLTALRKDATEFKCIIGIKKMRNTQLLVGYVRDVSELEESLQAPVTITNLNILDPVESLVDDESFDAIIIIDFSGVMKRVNATAVREFGYSSKDELEGKNVSMLVGGGMADRHDSFVKRFQERGDASSIIGRQRLLQSKRKDGTEFPSILGVRQVADTEYLVGHIKNMTGL